MDGCSSHLPYTCMRELVIWQSPLSLSLSFSSRKWAQPAKCVCVYKYAHQVSPLMGNDWICGAGRRVSWVGLSQCHIPIHRFRRLYSFFCCLINSNQRGRETKSSTQQDGPFSRLPYNQGVHSWSIELMMMVVRKEGWRRSIASNEALEMDATLSHTFSHTYSIESVIYSTNFPHQSCLTHTFSLPSQWSQKWAGIWSEGRVKCWWHFGASRHSPSLPLSYSFLHVPSSCHLNGPPIGVQNWIYIHFPPPSTFASLLFPSKIHIHIHFWLDTQFTLSPVDFFQAPFSLSP